MLRQGLRKLLALCIVFQLSAMQLCRALASAQVPPPGRMQTRFGYDTGGRLIWSLDPTGARTRYEYDALDRLAKINDPAGRTAAFTYDAAGRLIRMADWIGTTLYEYDIHGQLTAVTDPFGHRMGYRYDAFGRPALVTFPDGSTIARAWNEHGQLASLRTPAGTTRYTYGPGGALIARTLPNGVRSEYAFDTSRRLAGVRHLDAAGGRLLELRYDYDDAGRISRRWRQAGEQPPQVRTFEYGALARLREVRYADGEVVRYAYDAAGRRAAVESSRAGVTLYTYDAWGRMTRISGPRGTIENVFDGNGRLVERRDTARGRRTVYAWSPGGRLKEIDDGKRQVAFEYDGNGTLLSRTVDGVTTRYLYDWSGLMPEIAGTIGGSGGGGSLVQLPIGVDATDRIGGLGVAGGDRFYLADGFGTVAGTIDAGGKRLEPVAFDPFGRLRGAAPVGTAAAGTAAGGAPPGAPVWFHGLLYDPDSGLLDERIDPASGTSIEPLRTTLTTALAAIERTAGGAAKLAKLLSEPQLLGWIEPASGQYAFLNPARYGGEASLRPLYADPLVAPRLARGLRAVSVAFFAVSMARGVIGFYDAQRDGMPVVGLYRFLSPVAGWGIGHGAEALAEAAFASTGSWIAAALIIAAGVELAFVAELGFEIAATRRTVVEQERFVELLRQRTVRNMRARGRGEDEIADYLRRTGLGEEAVRARLGGGGGDGAQSTRAAGGDRETGEEPDRERERPRRRRELAASSILPPPPCPPFCCPPFCDDGGGSGGGGRGCPPFCCPPFCGDDGGGGGDDGGGGGGAGGGAAGAPVGGVSLDRVAELLADLRDIRGAAFDPGTRQLILYGSKNYALPPVNTDDLVVALRSIFGGQEPSMSIEPCVPGASDGCMKVVYNGRFQVKEHPEWGWVRYDAAGKLVQADPPATYGTHLGHVLYEADRYLKSATLGRDNLDGSPFTTAVAGFRSELARQAEHARKHPDGAAPAAHDPCLIQSEEDRERPSSCHRMWFVPGDLKLDLSGDGNAFEFEPVNIHTEARFVRFDPAGQMVDVPGDDPAVAAFVDHLNAHYADYCREKPELADLIQLAKIIGVVRWIADHDVPLDLSWIGRYRVAAAETPAFTTGVEVTEGRVGLYGGVELPLENVYRERREGAPATAELALAARPSIDAMAWVFEVPVAGAAEAGGGQQGGQEEEQPPAPQQPRQLYAVAFHPAPVSVPGGFVVSRSDATIATGEGGARVDVTLRYSSIMPGAGGRAGRGWSFELPSLVFRKQPAADDPHRYALHATLSAGAGREQFTLIEQGHFSPLDPRSRYESLGITGEDPYAPLAAPELTLEPRLPGQPAELFDASGAPVRFGGFAVRRKDGTVVAFDTAGRLVGVRDRQGRTVQVEYDGDLPVAITAGESGRRLTLSYDARARLAELTRTDGARVHYRYDERGDLAAVSGDGTGAAAEYAYDDAGHLARIIDAAGRTIIENDYDAMGRVVRTRRGDGPALAVGYDDGGQGGGEGGGMGAAHHITYESPAGTRVVRELDSQQRVVAEVDALGGRTEYEYDANGHLAALADAAGHRFELGVDDAGNVREVRLPTGDRLRYLSHDGRGQAHMVVAPDDRLTLLDYDEAGRLREVTGGLHLRSLDPDRGVVYEPVAPQTVSYDYDDQGRLVAVRAAGEGAGAAGGGAAGAGTAGRGSAGERAVRYRYDAAGRLAEVVTPDGERFQRSYDDAGRLLQVEDAAGVLLAYDFDKDGRLRALRTRDATLRVDEAGDRDGDGTAVVRVTGASGAAARFRLDAAGRLLAVEREGEAGATWRYDAAGRLVEARGPDGVRTIYEYDAVGHVTGLTRTVVE